MKINRLSIAVLALLLSTTGWTQAVSNMDWNGDPLKGFSFKKPSIERIRFTEAGSALPKAYSGVYADAAGEVKLTFKGNTVQVYLKSKNKTYDITAQSSGSKDNFVNLWEAKSGVYVMPAEAESQEAKPILSLAGCHDLIGFGCPKVTESRRFFDVAIVLPEVKYTQPPIGYERNFTSPVIFMRIDNKQAPGAIEVQVSSEAKFIVLDLKKMGTKGRLWSIEAKTGAAFKLGKL